MIHLPTSPEDKPMQLYYRGVRYQGSNSNLETTQGEITGFYRGVPWRREYLENPLVPQAIARLKYRGADSGLTQLSHPMRFALCPFGLIANLFQARGMAKNAASARSKRFNKSW